MHMAGGLSGDFDSLSSHLTGMGLGGQPLFNENDDFMRPGSDYSVRYCLSLITSHLQKMLTRLVDSESKHMI